MSFHTKETVRGLLWQMAYLLLVKPRQDDSHTVFSSPENTGHVTGLGALLVARCPASDKGAARRGRGWGVAGGEGTA